MHISIFFAAFVACVLVLDETGLSVFALFCVIVHEAGHFAALCLMKIPVRCVSLKIFGIDIQLEPGCVINYRQETILALSGCLANFLLCGLSGMVYICGMRKISGTLFGFSLLLGIFNLLPVGPLDGGRALECLLSLWLSPFATGVVTTVLSVMIIVPLMFAGVYLVRLSGYNFSLLIAAFYLLLTIARDGRRWKQA